MRTASIESSVPETVEADGNELMGSATPEESEMARRIVEKVFSLQSQLIIR
jgi:hypothetical protein